MTSDNAFRIIIDQVCLAWPEHRRFIDKAWANVPIRETANHLAAAVLQIAGSNLTRFIDGYRWMCGMMMEEDLHFQRHGTYRLTSFSEIEAQIYQCSDLMRRYMDGLLLSQVLWPNHVRAFEFYLCHFIAKIHPYSKHLEVGPGHGLLLHYAMQVLANSPEAWDVSPTAIKSTQECLNALGEPASAKLDCRDILTIDLNDCNRYDSIVISEVLEHSEEPERMLRKVAALISRRGRIYINVPVNSPCIDHIYLFRTPEEVTDLIERVGLEIERAIIVPAAGLDEVTARKRKTTISCVSIARPF